MGCCVKFGLYSAGFVGIIYMIIYFINQSSLPSGVIRLNTSFNGTADVYMEENGAARIVAENEQAALYANGYVLASRRLWQLEYLRRLAQGRMSEIFGDDTFLKERTVHYDSAIRTLGLTSSCQSPYPHMAPYIQGINDYALTHIFPTEFHSFDIIFQNWTETDSCTIEKLVRFSGVGDWGVEILKDFRTAITQNKDLVTQNADSEDMSIGVINKEEFEALGIKNQSKSPQKDPNFQNSAEAYLKETIDNIVREIEGFGINGGSSWVISGEHTASGKPIIASDTHTANTLPSALYFWTTEYPNGRFISGSTVPGIPYYLNFVTEKVAVAGTSIPADTIDIYKEKIIGDEYEYENKLYPLTTREEIIKVRSNEDVVLKINSTRHGPLMTKSIKALASISKWTPAILPSGDYSFKWIGSLSQDGSSFDSLRAINNAQSAEELLDLIKASPSLNQHVIFCDNLGKHGNIGYAPMGSYPKRKNGEGHTISRGWINENEWNSDIPADSKPYLFNPKKGYIVTGNNPITSQEVNSEISSFTLGTARAYRITEMVEELIHTKSGKISYKDVTNIFGDKKDSLCPKKKESFKAAKVFMEANNTQDKEAEEIIDKIDKWDCQFDKDLSEPLYLTFWEYFFRSSFMANKFMDYPSAHMKIFSHPDFEMNYMNLYSNISENPNKFSQYCTSYANMTTHSCAENMYWALNHTIRYMKRFRSLSTQWGDLHLIQYNSLAYTNEFWRSLYNKEVRDNGNGNTVAFSSVNFDRFRGRYSQNLYDFLFDPPKEFAAASSVGARIVSTMDGTLQWSLSTGISESLLSGHYFDMNADHINQEMTNTTGIKEVKEKWQFRIIFGDHEVEKKDDL
ncbi:unnamed protein product [Moneuplotes crassus]|uniref:Uncharacterized protein n=1 Tax=Euplotes crassus TaxID=5936 RepID=A0AAD1XWA0_EUPCR|nr:unnamed protein product [Moneuplotes crassus]